MPVSALGPVSEGLATVLQDATLQAATVGGWHDTMLPRQPEYPCGVYEVKEQDQSSFGTSTRQHLHITTRVYSKFDGLAQAQAINSLLKSLLRYASLTVTGFTQAGKIFSIDTADPITTEINGVPCHELVSRFDTWVEA